MYLDNLFRHLTYGELSQLSIGGAKLGGIQEEDYPQIISYLNFGLLEIYKKFPLKVKTLKIQLYEAITEYSLTGEYALNSGSQQAVKFIIDTASDPFLDDVLNIFDIKDKDDKPVPINLYDLDESVFIISPTVLQIPEPDITQIYTIFYNAYPVEVDETTTDLTSVTVNLPDAFLEAICSYIAHRAYLGLPNPEPNNSVSAYKRFLLACQEIKRLGLILPPNFINKKLDTNGYE